MPARFRVEHAPPAAEWDRFVAAHPAGHLLQTSRWGALKGAFDWRSRCVVLRDGNGRLVAGAQVLLRRAAGLTLAYVPRGPVVDWDAAAPRDAILAAVADLARSEGAMVLKVEPELFDTSANRTRMQALGFAPSKQTVQPPSTVVLDITGGEDEILQRMKSKWRYNVRLAARKDVTVRAMSRADLPAFDAMMQTTGSRDGFTVHTPDAATFLLAEYQGRPLASIVVFVVGQTAWYLWGASSNDERNRMPNHALQWAGIQWARAHGATRYDLWGIPDDVGRLAVAMQGDGVGVPAESVPVDVQQLPEGELWGVFRFKQGFGGQAVRYVGAWDQPLHGLGYRAYQVGLAAQDARRTVSALGPASLARRVWRQETLPPDLHAVTDAATWANTLAALPESHVLQSWEWGVVKGRTEWDAHRFAAAGAGGKPQAAFQLLTRRLPGKVPLQIGYVPKGPLADWADPAQVETALARVEAAARALGCFFVKIDPNVREDMTTGRMVQHALFRRGWRASEDRIQFKNTAYSDLTVGEEALAASMKSKWRYNANLAQRRGVTVRQGTTADLPAFYALYAETGARDGFLIRPESYYQLVADTFLGAQADPASPAGGALLVAEHPEESAPLAALFLMRYAGTAWYFYGASSERRRRDMPNYLLQWEALQWSLAQGCTRYDWWGAPTDLDDDEDGLQGVWRFKQGFGAEFQPHIGAWDFVISPAVHAAYTQLLPRGISLLRNLRR
jgi:peptidoglycan pentaglycine glycine transferase (the first glycine)